MTRELPQLLENLLHEALSDADRRRAVQAARDVLAGADDGDAARARSDSLREQILTLATASEELATVTRLMELVEEKRRALERRDLGDAVFNRLAFDAVKDNAPQTLQFLRELRTRAYGKACLLQDVDSGELRTVRVAQANYGFPQIGVVNRLAPASKRLVWRRAGDEVQVGEREYEILAVANLERHHANALLQNYQNFKEMELEDVAFTDELLLDDLRASHAAGVRELCEFLLGGAQGPLERLAADEQVDRRGDTEFLTSKFYLRTTELQEALMQRESSGLALVFGVAGSGKTSVALGRAKVVCDRTEREGEDEPELFTPETAVGFVLSSQLSTYLKKTADHLALHEMPIMEYRVVREDLFNHRRLDAGFQREVATSGAEADERNKSPEGTMAWLHAVERGMCHDLAARLRGAVALPPKEKEGVGRRQAATAGSKRTPAQQAALEQLWGAVQRGIGAICDELMAEATDRLFGLERLMKRVDGVRAAFADRLEKHAEWNGPKHSPLRQNVRNGLRERIVRALRLNRSYQRVVTSSRFQRELRGALGQPEAERCAARAADRLSRNRLSDHDIDVLLAMAHLVSVGYFGRDDRDPISQFAETTYFSQVFIDEFQDFTEVQLFLMGELADPRRRVVTVVGDLCQRLTGRQVPSIARCFPRATPDEQVAATLLENKRQRGPLARLSQAIRERALEQEAAGEVAYDMAGPAPRLIRAPEDQVLDAVFDHILELPRTWSTAVICPTAAMAERVEAELRDDLGAEHRSTQVSRHTDLCRRHMVHFTTPLEAKGLEFDAVVVPFAERFNLDDPIDANGCYVAISRPRSSLLVVASEGIEQALWGELAQLGVLEETSAG